MPSPFHVGGGGGGESVAATRSADDNAICPQTATTRRAEDTPRTIDRVDDRAVCFGLRTISVLSQPDC